MKALIRKEVIQMFRDSSSIITAFVLPLLYLFIYGYGVSLDIDNISTGVVLEDKGPLARSFGDALSFSRYFHVTYFDDMREPTDLLSRGKLKGIVVIPSYFTERYENPDELAPIQVIADGSEPNTTNFIQNYVAGAWINWETAKQISLGLPNYTVITPIPRVWFNEELRSQNFVIPGSLVIILTMTGTLLTALVIAREWERGTMEALMTTPTTIFEIIFSKLISNFVLCIGTVTICYLTGHFIFGVPFRGSFLALALCTGSYMLFALGMGLFISTFARSQFLASQITVFASFLPSFLLSGFIFDVENMPIPLRILTSFIPARYFVENIKTVYLVGDVWSLLLPNIFIILFFAAFVIRSAFKSSRKRLD